MAVFVLTIKEKIVKNNELEVLRLRGNHLVKGLKKTAYKNHSKRTKK